ncbi:MAG TPA: hypothetical protein DD670_06035 [Planctomycetaceae bacterium]|nr:hypothetical protein [Planctomycetaceae bacterium]
MLLRLLLLFTIVPLVELSILIWIGERIGLPATIALVIVTGIIGASLARREGLRCWITVQRRIAQGELPADSLLDGLLILVAGLVLITPGVLTDLLGFALLIRPVRRMFRRWLAGRFRARLLPTRGPDTSGDGRRDEIIDVRIIDASDDRDAS